MGIMPVDDEGTNNSARQLSISKQGTNFKENVNPSPSQFPEHKQVDASVVVVPGQGTNIDVSEEQEQEGGSFRNEQK